MDHLLDKNNKNIYGNNGNGDGIQQKWRPGHGHGPNSTSKLDNTDSTAPESVSINTNNINNIYKNCNNKNEENIDNFDIEYNVKDLYDYKNNKTTIINNTK